MAEFVKIDEKAIADSNYLIGLLFNLSTDKAPKYIIRRYASFAMNQIYEQLKVVSNEYKNKNAIVEQLTSLARAGRLRKHQGAIELARKIYYTGGSGKRQKIYVEGTPDKLRYIDILTNAEIGLRRKGIGFTKYPFNLANKELNPNGDNDLETENISAFDSKGKNWKLSIRSIQEGAKYVLDTVISYKASSPSGTTPLDEPKNLKAIDLGLKKYFADRVNHYLNDLYKKAAANAN